MGRGADAKAAAFVEVSLDGVQGMTFGVGLHDNIVTATILAVISGVNRLLAKAPKDVRKPLLATLTEE